MDQLNLPPYDYVLRNHAGRRVILDPIRKRFVPLTPEEWVRQHFVQYLINNLEVPSAMIAVEVVIPIQERHFRADIVVHGRQVDPVLIVECKRPSIQLGQDVFNQIGHYNVALKVPYLVVTNGMQYSCCLVNHIQHSYQFLDEIPSYQTMILPVNHVE
ncbi:MAG: type I restriction enzyme HsdR N-terminal domain-containing protein [Bacteroidetes bacterium]|nr:type I restriction enzyme HsdR N-terminal domain-containing protein [Bacteroidota bacterium]